MAEASVALKKPVVPKLAVVKQWHDLDKAFHKANPAWKHPSAPYKSTTPRIPQIVPANQATYDVARYNTIEKKVGKPCAKSSSWALSNTKAPTFKATTDVFYDAKIPQTHRPTSAATAFRSTTPRASLATELLPGQEKIGLVYDSSPTKGAKPNKPGGPPSLIAYRQTGPRFKPEPVDNRAPLELNHYTVQKMAGKPMPKRGVWARSTARQREDVKPGIDLMYDPPASARSRYADTGAFRSNLDRFPPQPQSGPAPGAYTSPFISVGMLP